LGKCINSILDFDYRCRCTSDTIQDSANTLTRAEFIAPDLSSTFLLPCDGVPIEIEVMHLGIVVSPSHRWGYG